MTDNKRDLNGKVNDGKKDTTPIHLVLWRRCNQLSLIVETNMVPNNFQARISLWSLTQKTKYHLRMIDKEIFLDKYSLEEESTLLYWSIGRVKPLYNKRYSNTVAKEYIRDRNWYWYLTNAPITT